MMDIHQILKKLPHRYPILLVDRVLEMETGKRIKAIAFRVLGTPLGELLLSERSYPLHIAGRLTIDDWGSSRVPSIQIEDVARIDAQ